MLLTVASTGLASCVQLQVTPTSGRSSVAIRQGVEYRLPFTQVKGTLVRRLAKCGAEPVLAIAFEDVAFKSAPDWTQRYVIDVQSLSSPMKTSSLKVERYPNGQLKSINAEAEDRSAAVVTSLVSTGLKFLTPIAPLGGGANGEECKPEAIAALNAVTKLKARLAAHTATLTADTKRLNGLLERLQLAGGAADMELRKAMTAMAGTVQKSQAAVTSDKAALEDALDKVTVRDEFLWPENPTDFGPKLMPLPDDKSSSWFTAGSVETMRQSGCIQLWLNADRPGATAERDPKVDALLEGVRYRESEPGAFVAMLAKEELPDAAGNLNTCGKQAGEEQYRLAGEVFQFGRLMSLPFRNRIFQSNAISATWDENGRMTMVSYGEKTVSAETVAKMLAEVTAAGRDTIAARRGDELADLKQRNALLEARIKEAELTGKLTPKADPNAEAIANLDADRRLNEATTANILAEVALRKAEAERDGQ